MTLSLGLVGCGTIGTAIAGAVASGDLDATIAAVFDRNPPKEEALVGLLPDPGTVRRAEGMTDVADGADLVVEAAGQGAVHELAVPVLAAGVDLLVLSVGAFADADLLDAATAAAESSDATLRVPSGAIAGLDAVKAAGVGGLESVSLTTTKPPAGLAGAPFIEAEGIDLDAIDRATTVFEGPAREAASAFPSNVNVAMALSLAGVGPDGTKVRIVADPDGTANIHEIEAAGPAGTIETRVENAPSPTNPRTSYLAPLSAIAAIADRAGSISVGT